MSSGTETAREETASQKGTPPLPGNSRAGASPGDTARPSRVGRSQKTSAPPGNREASTRLRPSRVRRRRARWAGGRAEAASAKERDRLRRKKPRPRAARELRDRSVRLVATRAQYSGHKRRHRGAVGLNIGCPSVTTNSVAGRRSDRREHRSLDHFLVRKHVEKVVGGRCAGECHDVDVVQ